MERPREGVVLLTLDRPPVNALGSGEISALEEVARSVRQDPSVRALVLAGGPKFFSAGADIKEMMGMDTRAVEAYLVAGNRAFDALEALPVMVVAALEGVALGGGAELAMAADLRVAGANAGLGWPEIKLGVIPGWGGPRRLCREVGVSLARYLVLSGETVAASQAYNWRLVHRLVPAGQTLHTALELATFLADLAPLALTTGKAIMNRGGMVTTLEIAALLRTADAGEGMAAFREKRKPKFQGR
jgi:enoyl-CoA hydratase/carnithine racemase